MEEKIYRVTCDLESDWGGRSKDITGIGIGLPIILGMFKKYKVKGLFFISTELFEICKKEIKQIKTEGHEIGSHGHFHIIYKDRWRAEEDYRISNTLLSVITGQSDHLYRAPKFSQVVDDSVYSNPLNHQGLLKMMWLNQKLRKNFIFYFHPFDIVGGKNPPNLFSKIWYSRPYDAKNLLDNLVRSYAGNYRLSDSAGKA